MCRRGPGHRTYPGKGLTVTSQVRVEERDNIAWVTIDNPPLNASSTAVRRGLMQAAQMVAEMTVSAAVLRCAGATFVAGADMNEFDAAPVEPHLPDVVKAVEDCSAPWIAAMHGSVFGGGLEIALGCAWRVATHGAKFALPEVNVGLVPGAGGTQRLPRLVGVELGVQMTTTGAPINAETFLEAGGLDRLLPDLSETTLRAFLHDLPERPEPVSQRPLTSPEGSWWADQERKIAKRAKGQESPLQNLELVRMATAVPFSEGQPRERELHLALRQSAQSRALRHAFFAERAAAHPRGIFGKTPRPITAITVVGGGLMGAGIATAVLSAGIPVVLIERDVSAAKAGKDRIHDILQSAVKRGRMSADGATTAMADLTATVNFADAAPTDLAIEAVFEDLGVKRTVFSELANVMRKDAIMATNTSYLDPNLIFAEIENPDRCLGLHFFSPAHIMKLLEIVKSDDTCSEVLATVFSFANRLRKTAVLSGVCNGFIGNRMLAAYRRQADYLLADGAFPQDIDDAMTAFGMPLGPYALQDLTGLQIAWANRRREASKRNPSERYVPIADRLCKLDRFGQRSGAGWYLYEGNSKTPVPDPDIERIIVNYSEDQGLRRRSFSQEEIQNRMLAVLVNEGALILEEGIAATMGDVDTVKIAGYGFPRWKGGPMHLGQELGFKNVAKWMSDVAEQSPGSWKISRLLGGSE
ncbi:MAG: 3-hydroxyacyl-CoA dehydrogenase NAD-binding domain-containing protein [Tateyamaria sp.]